MDGSCQDAGMIRLYHWPGSFQPATCPRLFRRPLCMRVPRHVATVVALSVAIRIVATEIVPPPINSAADECTWLALESDEAADVPVKGSVLSWLFLPEGTCFAGSNQLAVHDGESWRTIDIPGAYAFRALAADPTASSTTPRVYFGAIGAIGRVERDQAGRWRPVSLEKQLEAAGIATPGDVWFAQATGDGAIFVTSDRVLRFTDSPGGGRFEAWFLPSATPLQAANAGDSVLVYQSGAGLLRIGASGDPVLVRAETGLPASPLSWAVVLPSMPPGVAAPPGAGLPTGSAEAGGASSPAMLLGLGDRAFREDTGGRLIPLSELSAALHDSVPTCAVALDSARVAIGTLKRGLVVATVDGKVLDRAGAARGLPDDTIQCLAVDGRGRLWAGTDAAPAIIDAPGFATLQDRQSGAGPGLPREVIEHGGRLLALTSKGLYPLAGARHREWPAVRMPASLLDTQAVLWDAASLGDRLWIAGFGGLWCLDGEGARREYAAPGDILHVTPTKAEPGALLVMDGYVPRLVAQAATGWAAHGLGIKVADTPVSLLEDSSDRVWISTVVGGIYRCAWETRSEAHRLRVVAHYRSGIGMPRGTTHPMLHEIAGRIVAFAEQDILLLSRDGSGFAPLPETGGLIAVASAGDGPDSAYWLVRAKAAGRDAVPALLYARATPDGISTRALASPDLSIVGTPRTLDHVAGALWLGGTRGWLRFDTGALRAAAPPRLRFVRLERDSELLRVSGMARSPALLPAGTRRLVVAFAPATGAAGADTLFQTRLKGTEEDWSPPQRARERSFGGLRPGSYTLQARAVDPWGRAGPECELEFILAAPWWRHPASYATGAALLLLVAAAIVRLRLRRLRRQNEKLNRLVAERTRELELASTAKSEFLENISHELRNPLNGLLGMLGLLNEESLEPQQREVARTLKTCARQMARAFEDVLGFSKLEYGAVTIDRRAFRLRAVLGEVHDLHAAAARQSGCSLEFGQSGGFDDRFVGDPAKLKTIVSNFVSNALNYAPGSPVSVSAATDTRDDGLVDVIIEVSDQGPGIPADEQEIIFQKFVRGSGAKSARVVGSGIGLANCRVLARHLGGSVGVESEPGRGATFFLRVPLERSAAESGRAPAEVPTDGSVGHDCSRSLECPGPGSAALIVDDEAYNRSVLKGLAMSIGYTVVTAGDANEAFARLEEHPFAVVFLDWELPSLKGTDIARAIRARPGTQPLIIATTAHDSDDIRRSCRLAGMDTFLLKPYDENAVRAALIAGRNPARAGPGGATATGSEAPDIPRRARDGGTGLDLHAFELFARGDNAPPEAASAAYLRAIEEELSALMSAVSAGDASAITSHAHRLSSLSGLIGAHGLNAAARRLQAAPSLAPAERTRLLRIIGSEIAVISSQLGADPAAAAPPG